jgi:hypothetical protein
MMTLHSVKKMSVKIADASLMNVSATNLTGCMEMNSFTFSLTVTDQAAGSEPMTEKGIIDYIIFRLEGQSVITVANIVRDY